MALKEFIKPSEMSVLQIEDMEHIKYVKDQINHLNNKFTVRMLNNDLEIAKELKKIIELYEIDLKIIENQYKEDYGDKASNRLFE